MASGLMDDLTGELVGVSRELLVGAKLITRRAD